MKFFFLNSLLYKRCRKDVNPSFFFVFFFLVLSPTDCNSFSRKALNSQSDQRFFSLTRTIQLTRTWPILLGKKRWSPTSNTFFRPWKITYQSLILKTPNTEKRSQVKLTNKSPLHNINSFYHWQFLKILIFFYLILSDVQSHWPVIDYTAATPSALTISWFFKVLNTLIFFD